MDQVYIGRIPTASKSPSHLAFGPSNTKANFGPLTFNHDGTFQIAVFEDLHFGENAWDQWGPQQDINSVKVINEILDAESPGLVVLNGDLITGENTFLENSTTYVDQIVTPLVNRGLTWASTYGNHDHQYNITGDTILAREKLWPNSRTQKMVNTENSGVSNYYLPVYDTGCSHDGCVPELLLWFFDSKGGFKYQKKNSTGSLIGNPDWVDNTVVDWFLKKNKELVSKYNKQIPSLAFVHIPTYASYVLQKQGIDAHLQPGINDDNPLATQGQGWCADGRNDGTCAYGGNDIPFMQAISSTPGLIASFSGHDHGDSWCDRWDKQLPDMTVAPKNNVILCFSQHTGYGGYGNWERGSRQILVSKSKLKESAVDTWIRLESKSVAGRVTLNSTFGHDQYPATNNTKTYCPTCDYST